MEDEVEPTEEEDSWKAENDMRTLIDAQKIQADPERFKKAMAKAKEQMRALRKINA